MNSKTSNTLHGIKHNKEINIRASHNDEKYKVILKLINKILVNINKEEIDDLTKFVNINREDIVKDINKQSLIEMESELFPLFNKMNSGYYRKDSVAFVLSCLRRLLKEIGYIFDFKQKDKSEIIDGKSFRRKHNFYSIQ